MSKKFKKLEETKIFQLDRGSGCPLIQLSKAPEDELWKLISFKG